MEEELIGILPTQKFIKAAPFATKDLKVKSTTAKDGNYQLATVKLGSRASRREKVIK